MLSVLSPQVVAYPTTPEELERECPDIFEHFTKAGTVDAWQPLQCPIDEAALNALRTRMPTRKSHASINLRVRMHSLSKSDRRSMAGQVLKDPNVSRQMDKLIFESEARAAGLTGFSLSERHATSPFAIEDHPDKAMQPPSPPPVHVAPGSMQDHMSEAAPSMGIGSMVGELLQSFGGKFGKAGNAKADKTKVGKTKVARAKAEVKKLQASKAAKLAVKKTVAKPTSACKVKLAFPGVPGKAKDPIAYKNVSVYSDISLGAWRVKAKGVRTDRKASWKLDPRAAWSKVLEYISEGVTA